MALMYRSKVKIPVFFQVLILMMNRFYLLAQEFMLMAQDLWGLYTHRNDKIDDLSIWNILLSDTEKR